MMESGKKEPRKRSAKPILDGVAVCEKDTADRVRFQSPESVEICGHKVGEVCVECHPDRKNGPDCAMAADRIYRDQRVYSRVKIQTKATSTTILVPDRAPMFDLESVLRRVHLSPREMEIAGFISQNYTNAQLIESLVISESTLKSHLNSIYRKIPELRDFRNRLR